MSVITTVPFLDLVKPHQELKDELKSMFETALAQAAFVGGPVVEQFEREFAEFCGVRYCVGVSSGTDAVRFALIAAGFRPGEAVITVPNTFIATTEAISQAGGYPEFVDVDERTFNMDPEGLRTYLATRCRVDRNGRVRGRRGRPITAIVPVHLYGQTAQMDAIRAVAEEFGLTVIEDACQAHGAEYFSEKQGRWRKAGSMGKAAAFSFYPGKNLGACGEAGAVTTDDAELAQKVRMLRDHGQSQKYYHDIEGYNGRLDAIQAGVLLAKLPYLPGWNEQRRRAAAQYQDLLSTATDSVGLPWEPQWAKPIYHLYVIRVSDREGLRKHLSDARIGTGIHYPIPLHLQCAYSTLGYAKGDLPVSEQLAQEILSLPMYPGLEQEQQEQVANQVLAFISTAQSAESKKIMAAAG